ncbi:MAG: basic rane lipoprotein [Paenibacillus sp.]|uniref:BMP family lipoprotein n=1 Tax=Paenibacillus sp. GCM10012303 TaxID=3317340 RepID=UPI0029F0BF0B|nr:basic rane lipoprotein [Paenibacillus sp.]
MKRVLIIVLGVVMLALGGCSSPGDTKEREVRIGIMLSDVGLGDQSFSDSAFQGLIKARDGLGVRFDYREISETQTYEIGIEELVRAGNDLVVGLGFMSQESLESVAKRYPKQKFLLIDSVSELENVHSLTFKEDEGSFLIGVLAALKSRSGHVGFIGGVDAPVIRNFYNGYVQGVHAVKPDAKISLAFAEDFGNPDKGAELARQMIAQGADVLYPAAGLTGVGALKEAQAKGVLAFGVDSDQFAVAEKAVVSSMLKHIDEGMYQVAKMLTDQGALPDRQLSLGLKDNGVGIAPVRVVTLSEQESAKLESLKRDLIEQKIQIGSR